MSVYLWSSILSFTATVSVKGIALNLTPFKEQRIVSNPTIKKVKVKFPSLPFKMALICIAVLSGTDLQRPLSNDPRFVQFIYHYRGYASKSSIYLYM